ncbi:MAG: iron-containing alcohol dehydrogenase [Acidobacteriaceae bacterium]|nr:iron-containing alcohol dehydrogenase [Acidobacteriaceae bacterium]
MHFEFATAARIVFASGALSRAPNIVREFGTRALVITGRNRTRAAPLIEGLERAGCKTSLFATNGEPTLEIVRKGAQIARQDCELVIGFGGGSAIDTAKAVAALAPNSGEPLDYLEVIGKGKPLEHAPLPVIAIPTTAGTGAEVTRNAVLGSPEHRVKASLRSPLMLPRAAIVDPDLTLDLPENITASTGLDTLTQLIEPYVSKRANLMTDLFCREGLKRVSQALPQAFRNGGDRGARDSMSFASLLSGLALANAGLGVVHGFAAPLGGMLEAPHGALCAAVLPYGMAMNIRALRERAPESDALARYAEIAGILTGSADAEPEDGTAWVRKLCKQLAIPPLRTYGLRSEQIPQLVEQALRANSMKANPIPLTMKESMEIARLAL